MQGQAACDSEAYNRVTGKLLKPASTRVVHRCSVAVVTVSSVRQLFG